MRIMVFKNKYKEEERHPDYTIFESGEGDLRKIGALWNGHSAKAGDYFSGTIDEEGTSYDHRDIKPETTEGDSGDDIPF